MAGEALWSEFDLDLALEGLAMRNDASEMERVVKCLGEQIKLSRESMEKEWQALTEEAQISLETDVGTIKDFTKYLQEKVELEGHMCNTEPINLNVFLNNVVQALERNVGQEESIFDELTTFAAEQGLILPVPESESSVNDLRHSVASLNIVLSEDEETTNALWERIQTMIGRGLLASIDKLVPNQNKNESDVQLTKKIKLLEKMCVLYTPNDVWRKYLSIRSQQLKRFLQNPSTLDGIELDSTLIPDENIPGEATCLVRVSHALDMIFREDYNLVALEMFPEAAQLQAEEVYNVYLKDFKNELHEVIKRLHTLGRRGSVKLGDDTGNTLSSKIFLALRQCVLASSSADASSKKFLQSVQSSDETRDIPLGGSFGSTFSISSLSTSLLDINTASEVSPETYPEDIVRDEPEQLDDEEEIFCWQEEFKPVVSKLALAITESLQLETKTALQKELQLYEKSHMAYEAVDISEHHVNESLDYPKLIAKSCSVIMRKIDELAPFLLLKPGKEFEAVRNSFVESLTASLMTYQSRLVQISSDVPRSSPIRNLYLVFNSALYVQLELRRYEEKYGNISRTSMSVYNDLVESLYEKISSYHFSSIATVILQDAQSHHWMNQKEFFEGERCSFSVQMWNYYMQGVQHDLWQLCSPLKSQEIFTSVLQYSLSYFVRRYSKAIPTYKRIKLFRSDITAILFSVSSWMIFAVSISSTDIFNPQPTRTVISDIHNSCSALLAIMMIITCPLETLCVFTSGGGEALVNNGNSTATSWLSWLQPELYGEHSKSLRSLNDIQSVNVYFKLMINQPSPPWPLVLQTILLRDSYLAVTIVTYLENHQIRIPKEDEEDSEAQPRKRSVQFRSQSLLSADDDYDGSSSIMGSLYHVILKCAKRSKPLVNFFIALINRENSWQMFSSREGLRLSEEDKIPVWLDSLFSTFKPFVCRLKDLALSTLCVQEQDNAKSFKFTSISSLPCGCHVNKPSAAAVQTDRTRLIFEAFGKVLKMLASTVRLVPRIILQLFNRVEDDLRQLKLTSDETPCAGVKLLGSMLFRLFSAVNGEDVQTSCSWNENLVTDCKILAQIFYHVLMGDMEGLFETCDLPTALESLVKSEKDWIMDQVRKAGDIISEMDEDESFLESGQDSFLELEFKVRVKELFLDSKGEKAIKQVYNFFIAKKDWILRRIPLTSHLGTLQQSPVKSRADGADFNPLYAFKNLGEYSFDQEAIENFPFDWEHMFQSNIGMSLKSFKRLVFNRYELQNEQDVEEDKKELVEKLKTFYDPDTNSS